MGEFQIKDHTLVKYTGSSEVAVIPNEIRIVGPSAFQDHNRLKEVVIPDSVEEIRGRAFSGCTSLIHVTFSKNLRKLGQHVFAGCTSLETVVLPGRLHTINYCTFKGCSALTDVTVPEGTRMISESAFSKCVSLRTIRLPKTLERIKRFAFGKCPNLREVIFLCEGNCEIDTNSFYQCRRELSFSWPNATAFRRELEAGFLIDKNRCVTGYFGNAEHITIPESAVSIGEFAFCGNRKIVSIDVPETVRTLGRTGMGFMKRLRRVVLEGVEGIGDNAFWGCSCLEEISIPSMLRIAGKNSFGECMSLRELDFGNTEANFEGRIAPMSHGLERVVLPQNIESLPAGAFYDCRQLVDITLPYGIRKLGSGAFEGCKSLDRMEIPETVEPFDWNVFKGCSNLRELVLCGHGTSVTGRTDEFCTASARYADEKPIRQAVIFIGLQGSGKTYYYNWHFAGKFEHISLDELHTRNQERLALQACIENELDFVVDNTNPTRAERNRYIQTAKASGYRVIGYYFESKLHDCIRRNDRREGKKRIQAKAVAATSNRMELPTRDEGFDELYYVERSGETVMLKRDWRES